MCYLDESFSRRRKKKEDDRIKSSRRSRRRRSEEEEEDEEIGIESGILGSKEVNEETMRQNYRSIHSITKHIESWEKENEDAPASNRMWYCCLHSDFIVDSRTKSTTSRGRGRCISRTTRKRR